MDTILIDDYKKHYNTNEVVDETIFKGGDISVQIVSERGFMPSLIIITSINNYSKQYYLNENMNYDNLKTFSKKLFTYVTKKKRIYKINKLLDI